MAPRTRSSSEKGTEGKTTARAPGRTTSVTRRASARKSSRVKAVNDVVEDELEGSLGRGAGAPARAKEAKEEGEDDADDAQSDTVGLWTNTTSDGDSDGSGGLKELRRFIHPAMLKNVLAGRKRELEVSGRVKSWLGRALERLITSSLSVSSNNVLHVHRFYAWMYCSFVLVLENYLMVRGVRISGQTIIGLEDTASPSAWLRGVYTRYLPLAAAIDYFVVFMYFDVDAHGRARKEMADVGWMIRQVSKAVMRLPPITLLITGYPYPGHCFESAQVTTLLLSPVLSPIFLMDAFDRLHVLLCVCAFNFILFPLFFLQLGAAHPGFVVGRDLSLRTKDWIVVTLAPIALRAWLSILRRFRESRNPPKNSIDTFFITRGLAFRCWRRFTDAWAPARLNQTLARWHNSDADYLQESDGVRKDDVEAVAHELNMQSKELCEVLDGVRVMFLPIQTGFLRRRAMRHLMQTFMETYREEIMEDKFASVQIDFGRQEIWLRGMSLRPHVDRMADRLRLCVKETTAAGFAQHLSIRTVSFSTMKYRIEFSHVGAPLHFMHTSTCETQYCSVVGSTVVAIANGSAHVVRFIGKNLKSTPITARVGSGSTLPALGGRQLKWIGGDEVTQFNVGVQKGKHMKLPAKDDDDELLSDDVESYQITTLALLAPWRRSAPGHFEVQGATMDGDVSSAYGLIVTTDDDLIEEINTRFAHKILSLSDRIFILLVGHALGGECSERVEQILANIARARSLPVLAGVLDHLRDGRRAS